MTIYEIHHESRWARRRRINRMMTKRNRYDVGIVLPDRTWQVIAFVVVLYSIIAVGVVRWWLCV